MSLARVLRSAGGLGESSVAPLFRQTVAYLSQSSRVQRAAEAESSTATASDRGVWTPGDLSGPNVVLGEPKADLVKQCLGEQCMSASELVRLKVQEARRHVQRHESDVGSSEVQVAQITARVEAITRHLATNRKDNVSKRGLAMLLERRRKLLKYLKESDYENYVRVLSTVGLKDR